MLSGVRLLSDHLNLFVINIKICPLILYFSLLSDNNFPQETPLIARSICRITGPTEASLEPTSRQLTRRCYRPLAPSSTCLEGHRTLLSECLSQGCRFLRHRETAVILPRLLQQSVALSRGHGGRILRGREVGIVGRYVRR